MFEQGDSPDAHLFRWFLIAGCIGVAIAVVLTILSSDDRVSPWTVLFLWPTSVFALVDPRTVWSRVITGVFTFGGNFLLYALIGLVVGHSWHKLRNLRVTE
jgi:hypothetical protein